MTPNQIKTILRNHTAWLRGQPGGERADFRNADLSGADFSNANLRYADFSNANLSGADLRGADLGSADLSAADLRNANLSNVSFRGADLCGADLSYADLRNTNLGKENFYRADLRNANLSGADLSGADLSYANLTNTNLHKAALGEIRDDVRAILNAATPAEVAGLLEALLAGRVEGLGYIGECACLIGTIAKLRGCHYEQLAPNPKRPAERWYLAIRKGDTPETSQPCAIAAQWCEEWLADH